MTIIVKIGFTDRITGEKYLPGDVVQTERAEEIKKTLPMFVDIIPDPVIEETIIEESDETVDEAVDEPVDEPKSKKKRK